MCLWLLLLFVIKKNLFEKNSTESFSQIKMKIFKLKNIHRNRKEKLATKKNTFFNINRYKPFIPIDIFEKKNFKKFSFRFIMLEMLFVFTSARAYILVHAHKRKFSNSKHSKIPIYSKLILNYNPTIDIASNE